MSSSERTTQFDTTGLPMMPDDYRERCLDDDPWYAGLVATEHTIVRLTEAEA